MKLRVPTLAKISTGTEPLTTRDSAAAARMVILVFLLCGTLFLPAPNTATTVVALIDNANHRMVMATDCRVNQPASSISECKIIEEPGCTVAIAGLYRENASAFDLRKLVNTACRYPGDLREKAEAFLRISKKAYAAAVRHVREVDPNDYRRTIENTPTEVIFAGLLRGRLTLLVRGFVSDPNGRVTTERYESSDVPNSSIGYIAGLNHQIREQLKPHSQWGQLGYAEVARRFVQIEIDANPDLAGPPISELEIDDRGTVHWISRGACETREAD
jgi:hypothetical protein